MHPFLVYLPPTVKEFLFCGSDTTCNSKEIVVRTHAQATLSSRPCSETFTASPADEAEDAYVEVNVQPTSTGPETESTFDSTSTSSEEGICLEENAEKNNNAAEYLASPTTRNLADPKEETCVDNKLAQAIETRSPSETSKPKSARRLRFHPSALLWSAAEEGDTEELERLLSFLLAEKRERRVDEVPSLYAGTPVDYNKTIKEGLTLLHLCCFLGDDALGCIRLLLELGADVEQSDKDGWTPLNLAVSCNHKKVISFLLDNRVA